MTELRFECQCGARADISLVYVTPLVMIQISGTCPKCEANITRFYDLAEVLVNQEAA